MRKLIWTLVVLAVLLLVLDRGGKYVGERIVADNLASEEHLTSKPTVDIAGFPFLTQFARGRYQQVTATAKDVRVGKGDDRVTLSRVGFTFHDVRTNRDFSRFDAARGEANATIGYAELSRVLGLQISYAGKGSVKATKSISILGKKYSQSVNLEPQLLQGALDLGNAQLSGDLPPAVTRALQQAFRVDLPLHGLPFDIRADSLTADGAGIELKLSGKDLTYSS